ncbi:MAG: permease [Candidatus Melainabacteria bacterium GWF2_37_15]|nr:MAG: permease [Candidatus Melainabacteria bacterium GWF2_37_15]
MDLKKELKPLIAIVSIFLLFFFLPIGSTRFDNAIMEALQLTKWYAQEHVLLCLIPAFFIAGAIAVFVSQNSVMKYLGAGANKVLAYGVASVSGTILAVCSCTILPLFAGIYKMGAGLGPASAFLYSGPAINVLAIILTARILGFELGIARMVGAVSFSVIIGLIMHLLYRNEEKEKAASQAMLPAPEVARPLWQNAAFFVVMVGILVFANWGNPQSTTGFFASVFESKWIITSVFAALFVFMLPNFVKTKDESNEWLSATWGFAKQILPLLLFGVLISGLLLGRPGHEGLIPSEWITMFVGDNSILSNLFASVVGAFMYFATLTEVPILQGLIGNGMAKGPALALLLAGPALSLPNMLVIRSIMGTQKTVVFVSLVIVMATITGFVYGTFF